MNKSILQRKVLVPNHFFWMLDEEYPSFQLLTLEQKVNVLSNKLSRTQFSKLTLAEQLFDELGDEVYDTAVALSKYPEFFEPFLANEVSKVESHCKPIIQLLRQLAMEPNYILVSLDPIRPVAGDAYLLEALYARHAGTLQKRYLLDTY